MSENVIPFGRTAVQQAQPSGTPISRTLECSVCGGTDRFTTRTDDPFASKANLQALADLTENAVTAGWRRVTILDDPRGAICPGRIRRDGCAA